MDDTPPCVVDTRTPGRNCFSAVNEFVNWAVERMMYCRFWVATRFVKPADARTTLVVDFHL